MVRGRRLSLRGQQGIVTTFLVTVLAAAAATALAGFGGIRTAQQYAQCRQIASDLAINPNSHSQTEADNCATGLLTLLNATVGGCIECQPPDAQESTEGEGDPTAGDLVSEGAGLRQLLAAVEIQQRVRSQPFILKFAVSPPAPPAFTDPVAVTITVLNAVTGTPVPAGTRVDITLDSTDGSTDSSTRFTNGAGVVTFLIQGTSAGIVDTITVFVGIVTQSFSYTYI